MELTTHTKNAVVYLLGVASLVLMSTPFLVAAQQSAEVDPFQEGGLSANTPYVIENLDGNVVGDFVVGPGKIEMSLSPGESKTTELIVSNRMGEAKIFSIDVEDASGTNDPDVAVILLGEDRGLYTLKDYVSIENVEFELAHNQRARIPVTVSLPADAEPGGRYGSVLISTVARNAEVDASGGTAPSSAILSRVGTLFFITTPGNTDIAGSLQSFQTIPDSPLFLEGPIDFGLVYKNTGSVHLNPYGEIRIMNMLGEEVGFIELDPWFALPESLRTREVSWSRELLIGRYTATAFINRGYEDIVDEQTITFWVIPWKLVSVIFVGLFVFFLGLRFVATRFEFKRK